MIKILKELFAPVFVVAHASGGRGKKFDKKDRDDIKDGLERGKVTRKLPRLPRGASTRTAGAGVKAGAKMVRTAARVIARLIP